MKLNNKGISIIEIVLTFSLIMIMVIGMIGIVFNYREKASVSLEKLDMHTFKNTITKDIQDDILEYGVKEINTNGECLTNTELNSCVNIVFKNGEEKIFGTSKIAIGTSDEEIKKSIENKFLYYDGLKYKLNDKLPSKKSSDREWTDFQMIKIQDSNILSTDSMVLENGNVVIMYAIDVYISHLDFEQDFGIHIVASNEVKSEVPDPVLPVPGGPGISEPLNGTPIRIIGQNIIDKNTTYGNYTYMEGTYLKGEQDNNYVWYNGFLWRLMGINKNGSVRLILEGNATNMPYSKNKEELLYATTEGYAHDWLNNYFLSNLDSSKSSIIEESEWCLNSTGTVITTLKRITCDGGILFNAKVGLITLDEYNLSNTSGTASTNYLNNGLFHRTLTPGGDYVVYYVHPDGTVVFGDANPKAAIGIRPVINVSGDAIITSGDGTLGNAYILNQTVTDKKGKLNEIASSGDYVSLSGKVYRVVAREENGVKLIYDGYYEEPTGTIYKTLYGNDNTFSLTSGIGQKLNGDVLTWLGNSDKIVETNWYQATGFYSVDNYKTILEDKTNPIRAKVGMIGIVEMLSGESASVLTKKYTQRGNSANTYSYWTMNKSVGTTNAWVSQTLDNNNSGPGGWANYFPVNYSKLGIKPVIVVGTNTTVTSGNGTLQKPYMIG